MMLLVSGLPIKYTAAADSTEINTGTFRKSSTSMTMAEMTIKV